MGKRFKTNSDKSNKSDKKISNKNRNNTILLLKSISTIFLSIILFILCIYAYPTLQIHLQNAECTDKYCSYIETSILPSDSELESNSLENDKSFTISAIGDVMCHNTQYFDAYVSSSNTYNFDYVFEEIKHYTLNSDITIGSLETTFAGADRGYSNYPTFNSPDALAYSLSNIGIDILSTAGNHALDKGFSGLSRTIDVLNDAGISSVGTYKSEEERNTILFKEINDLKVAFLSYTYGTNGIPVPSDKPYSVNLIDKNLILKDIESAKSQSADVIIASMHWGTEYSTSANDEQIDLRDFLFENGVHIIFGNHPHVVQPMEKVTLSHEDGTTTEHFVSYALGNFICDQNYTNTRNSAILSLEITKKSSGEILIDTVEYTPIYMYKGSSGLQRMKLMDIETNIYNYENNLDTSISSSTYNLLKTELNQVTKILGDEIY